jgi:hypothetical protein
MSPTLPVALVNRGAFIGDDGSGAVSYEGLD